MENEIIYSTVNLATKTTKGVRAVEISEPAIAITQPSVVAYCNDDEAPAQ